MAKRLKRKGKPRDSLGEGADATVAISTDKLTANLTGGQVQSVLDFLILEALSPIVKNSIIFDLQISHLLTLVTKNKKRKVSALDREEFRSILCKYLVTTDVDTKVSLLEMAKVERIFLYLFVVKFLKEVSGYIELYHKWILTKDEAEHSSLDLRLRAIEASVAINRDRLFSTINMCTDYLEKAYTFRNSIVENYMKHALQQARAYCTMKGPNFDLKDVTQNLLTSVTKAIDKYDSSKGAMTSYVNFWILNVMTSNSPHGHEYGIAYTIPQAQKKNLAVGGGGEVNYSVSIEQELKNSEDSSETMLDRIAGDESVLDKLERNQEIDLARHLIKCADLKGMFRLYYEIEEHFSEAEFEKMRQTMIAQGIR